jgi:hypothetical protein
MKHAIFFSAAFALGLASLLPLAPAFAQAPAPQLQPGHPQPIPARTGGTITRYIVGPMGHVRGFVLDNNAVVMIHRRGGDALAQQAPVGQAVRVEGFAHPSNPQVIHRATVYAANGALLVAPPPFPHAGVPFVPGAPGAPGAQVPPRGPGGRRAMRMHRRQMMMARLAQLPPRTASGTVQTVVAGPRGGVRALLLSDGTSVFLHPGLTRALRQRGIQQGETVRASGRGNAYPQGPSLIAEQLTFADGTVLSVSTP